MHQHGFRINISKTIAPDFNRDALNNVEMYEHSMYFEMIIIIATFSCNMHMGMLLLKIREPRIWWLRNKLSMVRVPSFETEQSVMHKYAAMQYTIVHVTMLHIYRICTIYRYYHYRRLQSGLGPSPEHVNVLSSKPIMKHCVFEFLLQHPLNNLCYIFQGTLWQNPPELNGLTVKALPALLSTDICNCQQEQHGCNYTTWRMELTSPSTTFSNGGRGCEITSNPKNNSSFMEFFRLESARIKLYVNE